jgi:transposase
LDRKRKKKGTNKDWTNPNDPDATVTKMKDGSTHLAHKAEHAVDLETGAIVAVTIQGADQGDTTTWRDTVISAAEQIEAVNPEGDGLQEVVADKGYHSDRTLQDLEELEIRTYISEPKRKRRKWQGHVAARAAVYRNRRRIRGARGKRLLRRRGERLERPFARLYETGRMRRLHLRRRGNILKRVLVHAAAANLALLMRTRYGVGTPRSLQDRVTAAVMAIVALCAVLKSRLRLITSPVHLIASLWCGPQLQNRMTSGSFRIRTCTTAC